MKQNCAKTNMESLAFQDKKKAFDKNGPYYLLGGSRSKPADFTILVRWGEVCQRIVLKFFFSVKAYTYLEFTAIRLSFTADHGNQDLRST